MITAYAILATFFLGAFVRHNLTEIRTHIREFRLNRKVRRDIARLQKKHEDEKQKVGPNPFES